jgi:hypothetical protein
MLCQNCGTQAPERANYCWKCGKPMRPGLQKEDTFLESCEITFTSDDPSYGIGSFAAKAIGVFGVYIFGMSSGFHCEKLPDHLNPDHHAKLDSLINRLVEAGWEPTCERGPEWWNFRFSRKVKKPVKIIGKPHGSG